MIVSRTPLRVSLFGGGSDYPQFYNRYGGQTFGGSIDKYVYVTLHNGTVSHCFDLPNKSGLASSSAYTIGLLRACCDFDNVMLSRLATIWEQDKMNGAVGSQDQYLCAVGGFHHLKFSEQGIRDIPIDMELIKPLEEYLMLFNTHQYRSNSMVLPALVGNIDINIDRLKRIASLVEPAYDALKKQDFITFGTLLDQSWQEKRMLADNVSNIQIENGYANALEAGAIGGKLLGGGGGGFMVFLAEKNRQLDVEKALPDWTHVKFKFESEGSKVIYRDD